MHAIFIIPLLILLTACSNSSSGGRTNVGPTTPPVTAANLAGLWEGTLTYPDQTFEEVVGFTAPDAQFRLISLDTFGPDTFAQYVGLAPVIGDSFSGAGIAYPEPGHTWDGGATSLGFTIMGTIEERTTMTGMLQLDGGEAISFELTYDPDFEEVSSFGLVEGIWYVYDDLLNPVVAFTIEADGAFSAQSANGCASLGQVEIIDSTRNLYVWSVTISNCVIAGDYIGFAARDPGSGGIVVSISNEQRALLFFLEP